jgi:anti-sigma factor RsiW
MNCRGVTALIVEYLSGSLDSQTKLAWGRHLLDCRDCVAFFETYRKSIEALRTLPCKEISPDARNRIQRFLERRIKRLTLVH